MNIKKIKKISIVFIAILLFSMTTIHAGDIPYALLTEDNAKLYIGEIVEYSSRAKTATIKPIIKIKGDVDIKVSNPINIHESNVIQAGEKVETPLFWIAGGKAFKENEHCLVVDFGSNYDNFIYHISGNYPYEIIINDPSGTFGGEIQRLLNEGAYEKAENERLAKLGQTSDSTPTLSIVSAERTSTDDAGMPIRLLLLLAFFVGIILLQIFLSKRENKWLGLILPAINFVFSLIAVMGVAVFERTSVGIISGADGPTVVYETTQSLITGDILSTVFTIVAVFLLYNIPTLILLAIYWGCREKRKKRQDSESDIK